jgi:hypothetical protein
MEVVEPTPYDVLIEQCTNPNVEGAYDRAQKAIQQGADVNKLLENDGSFFTPILVLASYHPDPKFIQLLLDAGADPNVFSGENNIWTPLSLLAHWKIYEEFSRGENNDDAELAENNALYEHKKALIQVFLNSDKVNPNSVDPHKVTYCYDLFLDPKLLVEFIVKRNPSVEILDAQCFEYDRTLLSECCFKIANIHLRHQDIHFYERIKPYTDIISLILERRVNINVIDKRGYTALDYINERLPESIPPGDLHEIIKFMLATWNKLVDHGGMTKDELRLRETPAIKRTLGMNTNANDADFVSAAGAPSPQSVRHAFLRDWAQQLFGRREFGGRRVRARRVSNSRRHKRKTQRKSKKR